jgi:alkane 1-monooxygenase
MSLRFLKYSLAFVLPITAWVSFSSNGWITFLTLIYAFGFLPVLELAVGEKSSFYSTLEKEVLKADRSYDMLLYLMVPIQWFSLIWFLYGITREGLETYEMIGRTSAMGLLCGVIGVNVAHELGHRQSRFDRIMAKTLLASTSFLHFYIEHNRGHHRNVGTDEDPASAKKGEGVYAFWLRTVVNSFISAWSICAHDQKRKKKSVWSISNELLQYLIIELAIVSVITILGGYVAGILFVICSLTGILLLEGINYVEHYGLRRTKVSEFRYEDVQPHHSWNSNHLVSRLVLFELTRHSDHHMYPQKKYQVLENPNEFRQLPTGYAGMLILSLIPPLWRKVMDPRI